MTTKSLYSPFWVYMSVPVFWVAFALGLLLMPKFQQVDPEFINDWMGPLSGLIFFTVIFFLIIFRIIDHLSPKTAENILSLFRREGNLLLLGSGLFGLVAGIMLKMILDWPWLSWLYQIYYWFWRTVNLCDL